MLKIEKNIPMPIRGNSSVIVETANKMKIGDSVLVENMNQYNSLFQALKRIGLGAISKQEGQKRRVWCVQKMEKRSSIYEKGD
jgi:hypothetical protein